MEPRQAGLGTSPEQAPRQPEVLGMPEYGVLGGPERPSPLPEQAPRPVEGAPAVPVTIPVLPMPIITQDDVATQPAVTRDASMPIAAADEDLIEKEWVDKAKNIIEETKDDPYRREQEVGKLQREYIKKRYGRDIGDTGE